MCAICGIVYDHLNRPANETVLANMRDRMVYRGPDDCGLYVDRNVGLGHRRLSIVDRAGGHQPMSNEDDSIWVVFNGEIYNHRDLRNDLIEKGHRYKTESDTETIVHLYEELGPKCVEHLNGMFAFAIWDRKMNRLILARDRLGIKPLYYWQGDGGLVFASEVKALLVDPGIDAELREGVLSEYLLFRHLSGGRTFFKGIQVLDPGCTLVYEDGQAQVSRYWVPSFARGPGSWSLQDEAGKLEALFCDSVRMRLMSEVPLGTYCSGGVDSSLVTACTARLVEGRLNTFSVSFAERAYDESSFARRVARHCGTVHHELLLDKGTFSDALPSAVKLHDAPLNHANSVPLLLLSRLAKNTVTVMLSGEGADELFGGYPRYRLLLIRRVLDAVPPALRSLLRVGLVPFGFRKIQKMRAALSASVEQAMLMNAQFIDTDVGHAVMALDEGGVWVDRIRALEEARDQGADLMTQLLYMDVRNYLVSLLDRQDKMSMGAGIESRVPFLDYRIVERSLRLPGASKISWLRRKPLVKVVAERYLPGEIVHRRKSGFGVPIADWLRDPKGLGRYLALLRTPVFRERGLWNHHVVEAVMNEHTSGAADHSELLWEILNMELWCRLFLDGDEEAELAARGR